MFRVLALLCALATSVQAKMMTHTDLAGLALQSDSVFLAERTAPGHYKLIKILRGNTPPTQLDDALYNVPAGDVRTWVFLRGDRVLSLRSVVAGKVFRYEQRNNPGGWDPVPQGEDPVDQWRTTPQLDVPAFERTLTAAFARADAVKAAIAKQAPRDQLIALLAPAGEARAQGFYVDALANAVEDELVRRRDWAGLVEATRRDHRGVAIPRFTDHAIDLLAFARDRNNAEDLRVGAIRLIGESSDLYADLLPLVKEVGTPRVEAAAIHAIVGHFGAMSSDPIEQKQIEARNAAAMAELKRQSQLSHSHDVAYELAGAVPMPKYSAGLTVVEDYVQVDVRCPANAHASASKLIATKDGAPFELPAFNLSVACGDGVGGGTPKPFADGVYLIWAEVKVGKRVENVQVGRITATHGEVAID